MLVPLAHALLYNRGDRFIRAIRDPCTVTIAIRWPSGIHQTLKNVRGNQIFQVDEPAAGMSGNKRKYRDVSP